MLVVETDAKAVKLQFAANLKGRAVQSVLHALEEFAHFLSVVSIGQTQHWPLVHHSGKLVVQVASHTLRRTVGIEEFGMLRFQILQLTHLGIEFLVRDGGRVQHIIIIVVAVQLGTKGKYQRFVRHKLDFFPAKIQRIGETGAKTYDVFLHIPRKTLKFASVFQT